MAESRRSASEHYSQSSHVGSPQDEMEVEREPPILSLSESSTDMGTGLTQCIELAWLRQDLRKSANSAACPPSVASVGRPGPEVLLPCNLERGSVGSGPSTLETVAWREGTMQPWSVTEDPCHWAHTGEGCIPHSASSHSDLRQDWFEGREGNCESGDNPSSCIIYRTDCISPSLGSSAHGSCTRQGGEAELCAPSPVRGASQVFDAGCRTACTGHAVNTSSLSDTLTLAVVPHTGQQLPRPAFSTCSCGAGQRSLLCATGLGFPTLVSSVSESGLDGWRGGHCCGSERRAGQEASSPRAACDPQQMVREAGSMTSRRELRDVGVQVGRPQAHPHPLSPTSSSLSHVFPEVSLAEEAGSAGSSMGRWSPVPEVEWDAEGMTWEVYGAAVDSQELGLAIQRHLELQIRETAAKAQRPPGENETHLSKQSGRRRKNRGVMGSLRSPACCARSSTMGD